MPAPTKLSNRRRPPRREVRAQMAFASQLIFKVAQTPNMGGLAAGAVVTTATAANLANALRRGAVVATAIP